MFKSIIRMASLAIFSCFITFEGIAETEQKRINPIAEVMRVSAHSLGMNEAELNRAFLVISKFQAGMLTLPELDALSDSEILSKIDFYAEPYSEITNESMMVIWKRYEIETAMLAKEADVELSKFAPFYRAFIRTFESGKRLLEQQISQRNSDSASSYSTFSNGSSGDEIECAASCQALRNEDIESYKALLDIAADTANWESVNGEKPFGSTVRVVDSVSGKSMEVKKLF
ncbi:hypothetical protein CWE13_07225 [Aliidiomarina shirensis]|uniref:DUF2059 domain-containing protein n=1 Tax=Aliidiomarina shirensis TaxID=1048642 RepID=A0A432WVC8_9GAMM|nr:hypothetical protein [Aliidiomarina shirensis]RUO37730.1 hypothetical protein CWE13_07225 [Aliidiomarina shirensis]